MAEHLLSYDQPGSLRPFTAIQTYWNNHSTDWVDHRVIERFDILLVQNALSPYCATLSPEAQILDIAAGANNAVYYPPEFDMKQVWAMDASAKNLELNPSGHKLHADARRPFELEDSAFDLALTVFGMRYFENQEQVILETLRVLKNGSWLVMLDYFNAHNEDAVRFFSVEQLGQFAKEIGVVEIFKENLCSPRLFAEAGMDLLALRKPN